MSFGLRSRLFFGYAMAIVLFTLAGVYALHSLHVIDRAVHQTNAHPLTVTRAALQAGSQITSMHRYMKDVVLSSTPSERARYLGLVSELECDTFLLLRTIRENILGEDGQSYAQALEADFIAWQDIRNDVIKLVDEGRGSAAQAVTREAGEKHVRLLMGHVSEIRDHASSKAVLFLTEAERTTARTRIIAIALLVAAILMCIPLAAVMVMQLQREMEQRVGAQRELEKGEQFVRRALDSQTDTFFLFDPASGRALRWNCAFREISGYTDSEIAEMPVPSGWYSPDDVAKAVKVVEQVEAGGIGTVQLSLKTKSGATVPTEYVVTGIRDGEGRVTSMISIGRDIRERNRMEHERQEMERHAQHVQKLESLGVLAGGIAHDFNNILVGVMGNVGLALDALPGDTEVRAYLEDAEQASKSAADLCRQMLAYAGKGRFVVEVVSLTALVNEMRQLLMVSVSKSVELVFELDSDLPAIRADATQLRQLILNLVVNGAEAIAEQSGRVVVTTCVATDGPGPCDVVLAVSDTGCGMDAATRQRMFEPFFTTKFVGRGLGLSAVQGIVRGHDGTVHVESEEGRGTRVEVRFHATASAPAAVNRERETTVLDGAAPGDILVIDDEVLVLATTRKSLERAGLTVHTFEDSREGVVFFNAAHRNVACVLVDLTMPTMDGEATLVELQKIDRSVPVVLMSGYDEHDIMARFEGRHLAGFLQKPFPHATLLTTVRGVMAMTSVQEPC